MAKKGGCERKPRLAFFCSDLLTPVATEGMRPLLKILVVARIDEAVETRHGFTQPIGIDADSTRQFAKGVGPVDPFQAADCRKREVADQLLFPVLRVEDQITRHVDGAVSPDVELPQLGGYFTGGFIGEAFAGPVHDDAMGISDFPGTGAARWSGWPSTVSPLT